MELKCRARWPMCASYDEDAKFRNSDWNNHFDPNNGPRIVMHDTSNMPLPQPSSGDLNRALYNKYYSMCCAKAGIAVQLCCWTYGLPLVAGHSDDNQQIEQTRILQLQKLFSNNDSKRSDKDFFNIFDKGCHLLLEALKHDQQCWQPSRSKDGKQFGREKVLHTGCVAVVRSGNERGVKRCKLSWFLKRGCVDQLWDIDFLCDVWEAFTFRVNFMKNNFQ